MRRRVLIRTRTCSHTCICSYSYLYLLILILLVVVVVVLILLVADRVKTSKQEEKETATATTMAFWESVGESPEDYLHASLHYNDVASSGPAARPLEFPTPTVYRCERIELVVKDHLSGTVHHLRNVIMKHDSYGIRGDTAYLVKKKLGQSVYGSVRLCIVLKRCCRRKERQRVEESREDASASAVSSEEGVEWESTDRRAVIKASAWSRIHAMRGRHLEDPIKEIAAMQHLGNYNPHVLGALEVLQDDEFLYTIMKHLPNGDLYGRLLGDSHPSCSSSDDSESGDSYSLNEKQVRVWFRQLLLVSLVTYSSSMISTFWNWNQSRPHLFRPFYYYYLYYRGCFIFKRKVSAIAIFPWRIFYSTIRIALLSLTLE